eukprot:11155936-Lingulodinium_polyedra.AAC.1
MIARYARTTHAAREKHTTRRSRARQTDRKQRQTRPRASARDAFARLDRASRGVTRLRARHAQR